MKKHPPINNRREFLKKCGLSALPLTVPAMAIGASPSITDTDCNEPPITINFVSDGLAFSPNDYLHKLNEIQSNTPIEPDFYGNGGATKMLEEAFAELTGKERAIYLPTGTMANQIAIKLLSGHSTKVIVPENSHVFRDEADAAQSVHGKRLIPLGKGKPYFDLDNLKDSLEYIETNEVFKSGMETIVIENPVRRADGQAVPLSTIQAISLYCQEKGYKLHLDGARIHLASAFMGIPVKKYASYFDTVYISLYKYLNAAGGAILCGKAEIVDQLAHQIKIYGGTAYQTWTNTAVALHYLKGIDARFMLVAEKAKQLVEELNKIEELEITTLPNGTNINEMRLSDRVDLKTLANSLHEDHSIWLGRANPEGVIRFATNESILYQDLSSITSAFKKSILKAKKA